jgi:dTDP-glucose pyrophosphorylase
VRNARTPDADADDDAFGIFVLDRVGLAVRGMKEKPSAPHSRLACIHLHSPYELIGR